MDDLRTIVPKNYVPFYHMGANCSEFRIPSGTIQFFRCGLRTIVPKNVFLLITWERVFCNLSNVLLDIEKLLGFWQRTRHRCERANFL